MSLVKPAWLLASILLAACSGSDHSDANPGAATPIEDFHFIAGGFSRGRGPDGNTEIFTAADGLVVVDTGRHPGHAAEILAYAAEKGLPVVAIVNTHWHLDHTTGNADIKAAYPDAKVYATRAIETALAGFLARGAARSEEMLASDADLSEKDRAEIERGLKTIREPAALLPDVAVEASMVLPVNGRDLQLYVTDHAVSEADIWIWDEAAKTAIVGDLVTLPAPFLDTACPEGWLAAFEAIEEKPYARIIPGHGEPMAPEEFRLYRGAFENLLSCAAEKSGSECGAAWIEDAAALLKSDSDRNDAPKYVEYYVDQVLKSAAHRAEFCKG